MLYKEIHLIQLSPVSIWLPSEEAFHQVFVSFNMSKHHYLLNFALFLTIFHIAISQPIEPPPKYEGTGADSRNVNPNEKSFVEEEVGKDEKVEFPFQRANGNEKKTVSSVKSLRPRRSSGTRMLLHPPAELQTLMSGNWQTLDPNALFKLLNTLQNSKETLADDYYGDDNDEDAIDLVYSGKKPLVTTSGGRSSSSLKESSLLSEPISIMSSNKGRPYQFTQEKDDDDYSQPLQIHRYYKKSPIYKRSTSYIQNALPWIQVRKDLVQLPNGEIAFTPRGMHLLRFHTPPSALNIDEELPLIRRPIL